MNDKKDWTEIEYRTKLADCIIKEIKAKKDSIDLEVKHKNICRIDVALDEFNRIAAKIADALKCLPDEMQAIVPTISPEQYKQIQSYVYNQMNILHEETLNLSLTPLDDQRRVEAERKANTRKKAAGDDD